MGELQPEGLERMPLPIDASSFLCPFDIANIYERF
jgi:hypothetical protein